MHLNLFGQVGLQGAENYYVRVDVDLITPLDSEFEEEGWQPADVEYGFPTTINTYESEVVDFNTDPPPPEPPEGECINYTDPNFPGVFQFNCYQAAVFTNPTPKFWDPMVSVDLTNIGVGNIYIDNWLDTMLYTRDKKMWGYDKMYIRPRDHFYIGVHARNTRHLPYNVEVTIGTEFKESADFIVEKRFDCLLRSIYSSNFSASLACWVSGLVSPLTAKGISTWLCEYYLCILCIRAINYSTNRW